jgi:hypothetical protein
MSSGGVTTHVETVRRVATGERWPASWTVCRMQRLLRRLAHQIPTVLALHLALSFPGVGCWRVLLMLAGQPHFLGVIYLHGAIMVVPSPHPLRSSRVRAQNSFQIERHRLTYQPKLERASYAHAPEFAPPSLSLANPPPRCTTK